MQLEKHIPVHQGNIMVGSIMRSESSLRFQGFNCSLQVLLPDHNVPIIRAGSHFQAWIEMLQDSLFQKNEGICASSRVFLIIFSDSFFRT